MHHFFHIQADSVISRNQDKTGYTDISDDRNRNINPGTDPVRHTAVRGVHPEYHNKAHNPQQFDTRVTPLFYCFFHVLTLCAFRAVPA